MAAMRILIASPVPPHAIAGPATVARELARALGEAGDTVSFITFSNVERHLPLVLRHFALSVRAVPHVWRTDALILLDPASTGPALALLARVLGRPSLLRLGGDFLWESYVERTGEAVLLSEFYTVRRRLTVREQGIRFATLLTLRMVGHVVFTTAWQRALWERPYGLTHTSTTVVPPVLASRENHPATGLVFLAAHRASRVKNADVLNEVWARTLAKHPDAILDQRPRTALAYHEAMRDCYAVIVPSLSEVSPNAVLEALSCGKPFIATADTGVKDELAPFGLFVDTRDPVALASAVETLLDPEVYATFRARIADFTTVRTWKDVAQALRGVLVS